MNVEFAILGSTPMAAVLAGALSKLHGRSVCWAGRFAHPLRPQRGFDMSVSPLTRPETWQLLRECTPEFTDLVAGMEVTERVDPLFVARQDHGTEVISHMQHVAAGFGYSIERQAISDDYSLAVQFRDAVRLLRRPFAKSAQNWLTECGVHVVPTNDVSVLQKKSGVLHLEGNGETIVAQHVVLADDDAIFLHAKPQQVASYFSTVPTVGYLIEPVGEMKGSVVHDVDSGLTIYQRKNGALDCVASDLSQDIEAIICDHVGRDNSVRLAGKTNFGTLCSKDGAAFVGELRPAKPILLGGFGATGLFQTPAIARLLTENATNFEKSYFDARRPAKSPGDRADIAEFLPFSLPGNLV